MAYYVYLLASHRHAAPYLWVTASNGGKPADDLGGRVSRRGRTGKRQNRIL